MTKHFIEFYDNVFSIEDVQCVERYYSYRLSSNDKIWESRVTFNTNDRYFTFPESKYEEIKKILLEFSTKNL